jgi:hypothetical protein
MRLARWSLLAAVVLAGTPVFGRGPDGSWEGYMREARQARTRGRYVDAAKLFGKARAVAEAARPPDDRPVESLEGLAGVYGTLRREIEAESLLRRAVGPGAKSGHDPGRPCARGRKQTRRGPGSCGAKDWSRTPDRGAFRRALPSSASPLRGDPGQRRFRVARRQPGSGG